MLKIIVVAVAIVAAILIGVGSFLMVIRKRREKESHPY